MELYKIEGKTFKKFFKYDPEREIDGKGKLLSRAEFADYVETAAKLGFKVVRL